ncbi:MAG: inositol monophosphatase, partial [Candidatus Zixiibacteriota bacterium]
MTSTVPSIKELRHYARFARDLAIQAGTLLKQGFSRSKQIRYKGRIDPVTQYDVKSEKLIVKAISKTFPTHSLLTEEGHNIRENSGFRWVVDPLDGTVNFAHGFPVYCVSIALEYDGEQVVGVVYDP